MPCAVVSPWPRPHYVSHRVFDHTSICALVEAKWNLPALTCRDANAGNMLDMLDLRRPAFLAPPALAQPLLGTDRCARLQHLRARHHPAAGFCHATVPPGPVMARRH